MLAAVLPKSQSPFAGIGLDERAVVQREAERGGWQLSSGSAVIRSEGEACAWGRNESPQSRDILYSNLTHRSLCAVSVSVPVYTTSVMVRGSPTIGMYSIIPRSSRSPPQRPIHPPRTFRRNISPRIDAVSWAASSTSRGNHSNPGNARSRRYEIAVA